MESAENISHTHAEGGLVGRREMQRGVRERYYLMSRESRRLMSRDEHVYKRVAESANGK